MSNLEFKIPNINLSKLNTIYNIKGGIGNPTKEGGKPAFYIYVVDHFKVHWSSLTDLNEFSPYNKDKEEFLLDGKLATKGNTGNVTELIRKEITLTSETSANFGFEIKPPQAPVKITIGTSAVNVSGFVITYEYTKDNVNFRHILAACETAKFAGANEFTLSFNNHPLWLMDEKVCNINIFPEKKEE